MDDTENPAAFDAAGFPLEKREVEKRRKCSGLQFETAIYVYL